MTWGNQATRAEHLLEVDVFCSRQGDAWRVYLRPGRCPPFLNHLAGDDAEVFPVLLDFEDLESYLEARGASVRQRWSRSGGVQLSAEGPSAMVLARWLATALSSGLRT